MSLSRAAIVASICLGLTAAGAQQRETASTACNANMRGTINCPTYTAPATTAVQHAAMDGSMAITAQTSVTLFNGAVSLQDGRGRIFSPRLAVRIVKPAP
jgi:hypothetical protein